MVRRRKAGSYDGGRQRKLLKRTERVVVAGEGLLTRRFHGAVADRIGGGDCRWKGVVISTS